MFSIFKRQWERHQVASWFVPPIVLPPVLVLLIILYAVFRAH